MPTRRVASILTSTKKETSVKKSKAWSRQDWCVLLQDIQNAYEDVSAPRRAFALTATQSHPYRNLVADLEGIADLQDDTDINCDVCFSYILEANRLYSIRLSMVGPYAAIARVDAGGGVEFITADEFGLSEIERKITRLVEARQFQILTANQMSAVVDLALPEVESVKVYNALFSPEEEFNLSG